MTDDILEKAMDAAEAELEATADVEQEATPSEDPVETQEIANRIAPEKKQRTKTPEPESEETEEAAPQEAAPEPEPEPASDLPEYMPAKVKAALSKVPKEVRDEFIAYDQQRTEWANKLHGESSRGKQIEQKMGEVYEPYRQKLAMAGIRDPLEATSRVLAWNEMLTSDNDAEAKKAFSMLLRQRGWTPEDLHEEYGQQEPDPHSEALEEARAAREELEEFKRSQAAERANQEIAAFRAGKDSSGAAREPLVRMFEPQIADALIEIRKIRPDLSASEQLHHAYEYIVGEARKSGILATPQQRAPAAKALAAASSVSGSPGVAVAGQRAKAKGIKFEDKLNSALDDALDSAGL
jgi:hypothetical protein